MNREEFAKICEARDVLCAFCEVQECEKCIVTQLVDDAANELPEEDAD